MVSNLSLLTRADSFDVDTWRPQFDQILDRSDDAIDSQVRAIDMSGLLDWLTDGADGFAKAGDAMPMADDGVALRSSAIRFPQPAANDVYVSGRGENGVFSNYNVEIVFLGNWPENLRDDFVRAADYLSVIIRGDVADSRGVDDLRITAQLQQLDGPSGLLAFAGPTSVRGNGLPDQGRMVFDIPDATRLDAEGNFDDVVLHEMLHAVGYGTVWDILGLTSGSVQSGDMRFTGENATLAYHALFPQIANRDPGASRGVPVETDGGTGTAGAHWDEATFRNELMTGLVDPRPQMSGMSIASLEDLGYDTIFDARNPGAAVPQLDDLLLVA